MCLLGLLLTLTASPATASGSIRRVVLGVPDGVLDQASQAQLLLAVQAHVSSLGVIVEMASVEGSMDGATSLAQATETSALCVAWLSPELDRLTLMTPTLGEQVRVRDLPAEGDGWLARCDVVATLLHSELATLIGPVTIPTEFGGTATTTEAPAPRKRTPVAMLLSVRWAPFILSSEGPFLQGVAVGAGVEIARRVTVSAGMGVVQPVDLDVDEARLGRWPGRVAVSVLLPQNSLELELELGVLLDVWRVLDLGYEPAEEGAGDTHLDAAVAAAGRVRYRVTPWLVPFIEVGADIYAQRRTFALYDATLLARDPALLRVGVGVTFLVDAR